MQALITGIAGFVGGHLAPFLRREGVEVWGLDRAPIAPRHAATGTATAVEIGDVCDPSFTDAVVREARPTHVFHLAGSYGRDEAGHAASNDPDVVGFTVLLESLRRSAPDAWVMLASSSAVYGAADRLPIDEDAEPRPTTAYGASKVAAEIAGAHFGAAHGMHVVSVRTFNLLGPGLPGRLFAGSIAAQVVAAERGGARTIKAGRMDSRRDYVDVRDAVRAYFALARLGSPVNAAYNVCTGVSHSCQELADQMFAMAGVPLTLLRDQSRLQHGDIDEQRGSSDRLSRSTGWSPEIAFATSVRDVLDYERETAAVG